MSLVRVRRSARLIRQISPLGNSTAKRAAEGISDMSGPGKCSFATVGGNGSSRRCSGLFIRCLSSSREGGRSSKHAFADKAERDTAVEALSGWTEAPGGRDAICKSFSFANFNEAFAFMTRAAMVAEKMDHHPEWFNVYDKVDVTLATHNLGGVSRKDIILAKKLDEFAGTSR